MLGYSSMEYTTYLFIGVLGMLILKINVAHSSHIRYTKLMWLIYLINLSRFYLRNDNTH